MEGLDQNSYLYYKLKDIRRLYEGFEDYLSEKYITKEEMLDVLSDVVPQSEILKDSVVAMDGVYRALPPVQDRLLGELLRVCGRVMITVEMDEREDPFVYRHPYQLFALSKQMVTSLVEIAPGDRGRGGGAGVPVRETAVPVPRKSGDGIPGVRAVPLFGKEVPRR